MQVAPSSLCAPAPKRDRSRPRFLTHRPTTSTTSPRKAFNRFAGALAPELCFDWPAAPRVSAAAAAVLAAAFVAAAVRILPPRSSLAPQAASSAAGSKPPTTSRSRSRPASAFSRPRFVAAVVPKPPFKCPRSRPSSLRRAYASRPSSLRRAYASRPRRRPRGIFRPALLTRCVRPALALALSHHTSAHRHVSSHAIAHYPAAASTRTQPPHSSPGSSPNASHRTCRRSRVASPRRLRLVRALLRRSHAAASRLAVASPASDASTRSFPPRPSPQHL